MSNISAERGETDCHSLVHVHHQDIEPGESSDGEGDVEVEHIVDEHQSMGAHYANSPGTLARSITRRTTITVQQKAILEEFFQNGMTSASMSLNHMHVAASEKTGLDQNVIKNWVRNRRRPTAQKMAERIAEKLVQDRVSLPINHSSTPPALVSATTSYVPAPHTATRLFEPVTHGLPMGGPLEAKRICLDSIAVPFSHLHPHGHPLLLKVRVAGSSDSDFVELELCSPSYQALLRSCCEELELQPSDILKIRKLPNVWVRKDRDVQRMREGQELEVVVRPEVAVPITSILTVNPFQSGSANHLPLISLQTATSRADSEHLMASLATEVHVPSSLQPEMGATQVNGLQ